MLVNLVGGAEELEREWDALAVESLDGAEEGGGPTNIRGTGFTEMDPAHSLSAACWKHRNQKIEKERWSQRWRLRDKHLNLRCHCL